VERENANLNVRRRTCKMHQNPAHRQAPPNAAAVAQQGPHVGPPRSTLRCSGGTRGSVRGQQLQEICGTCHLPEPPRVPEATSGGGGRVRILTPRSSRHSLRRNTLRTPPPLHFTIRSPSLQPLRRLSRPSHKQPRLLPPISTTAPLNQTQHTHMTKTTTKTTTLLLQCNSAENAEEMAKGYLPEWSTQSSRLSLYFTLMLYIFTIINIITFPTSNNSCKFN